MYYVSLTEKAERQTVISFKNLLLSQPQVSFGNSYRAMVEQFHEFANASSEFSLFIL